MMGEMQPLIRIALYIGAGYLAKAGLPPELVHLISNDPGMIDLIGQAAASLVALVGLVWWRIAKRMRWTT